MLNVIPVESGLHKHQIIADSEYIIREVIENRNIVILKGAFDARALFNIRQKVFQWGQNSPASNPEDAFEASYHRIDNNPLQSETRHIFHAFNMTKAEGIEFFPSIESIFLPMKALQETVSGKTLNRSPSKNGIAVRPQFIHYPQAGGFFDWHTHPFEPQRVGLILSLSKKNQDFSSGGTSFRYQDQFASIEDEHDIGDIALFRYDLPHRVEPIDEHLDNLDFDNIKGKWSFVLPFY